MFDQDVHSDIDETAVEIAGPVAANAPRRTLGAAMRVRLVQVRGLAARWAAPVAVIIGLATASQSVFRLDLVPGATERAVATSGGFRAALFRESLDVIPADLIVYEADQYANFMRGIVRFSDSDLLEYAATTTRDLGRDLNGARGPMTPYLLDALLLTNQEIERRGLSRPMVVAAFESERESFRARQQDL